MTIKKLKKILSILSGDAQKGTKKAFNSNQATFSNNNALHAARDYRHMVSDALDMVESYQGHSDLTLEEFESTFIEFIYKKEHWRRERYRQGVFQLESFFQDVKRLEEKI
jgi:hypothetical protein